MIKFSKVILLLIEMEANIINISNFDQFKFLFFKKCVFSNSNKGKSFI